MTVSKESTPKTDKFCLSMDGSWDSPQVARGTCVKPDELPCLKRQLRIQAV